MLYEDESLEDQCEPLYEQEPTQEELEAIEAELEADRDYLLEQQELEDYENHYGPVDCDEPPW